MNKQLKIIGFGIVVAGGFLCLATTPTQALSGEQRTAISQNCVSIQASLQRLQKADSRTRVFLGTSYEHILTNYMSPLNVRLTKNNRIDSTLFDIQTQFASQRRKFTDTFTSYMKSLDDLIATDCTQQPDGFYNKLENTRKQRGELHQLAQDLHDLTNKNIDAVKKLRDSL